MWDHELDPLLLNELTAAHIRHEWFKAQLIALAVGRLFGGKAGNHHSGGRGPYRRSSADTMLQQMGMGIA